MLGPHITCLFAASHRGSKLLALNPGFSFRILSRSDFSPKLQDKIRNGKPGFEASKFYLL